MSRSLSIVARVAFVVYLAALLYLTLAAYPENHPPPQFIPFFSIVRDVRHGGRDLHVNILGNLVAFAPFGFLLPIVRPGSTVRTVAAGSFALSLSIEVVQFASGRRTADVDDVLLNVVGALIGYGFLAATARAASTSWRRRRKARRP